jgi:hypothetical protein
VTTISKTTSKAAETAKKAINAGRGKAKPGKAAPLGPKAKVAVPGVAEKAMSTSARKSPVHSMSSEACEGGELNGE